MNAPDCDAQDVADMARLNAGHDAALSAIMDRHAHRLFHYLVRQLDNEADAGDLAQETFARIYRHRARYRPAQKFSTWLYAIATNLIRDRYRWRARHPQVSLEALDEETGGLKETLPDAAASPSDEFDRHERAAAVRKAVQSLPDELRTVIILSEYEDLPHAEIGTILNCTAKAVETRLYRARAALRKLLASLH